MKTNNSVFAIVRISVYPEDPIQETIEYWANRYMAMDRADTFNQCGEEMDTCGGYVYVIRGVTLPDGEITQDDWQIGDKVVCLDGAETVQLKTGQVYTIDEPGVQSKDHVGRRVKCISLLERNPSKNGTFSPGNGFTHYFYGLNRFRKVK